MKLGTLQMSKGSNWTKTGQSNLGAGIGETRTERGFWTHNHQINAVRFCEAQVAFVRG